MDYVTEVIEKTAKNNPDQPEFLQAVTEVLTSIKPIVDANEALFRKYALLERLVEPDRIVSFRVTWKDDAGKVNVNKGYRVQFNNAIGPYKGGLRFHPSVNLSILKFLGFEQTFKNSLTSLPMGGGKGGADFDPNGRSDTEIMSFCQAFMTELYRHIGPDVDVPAGDIGVGGREVGYLFGQYKRIRGAYENGVLTGKGLSFGGSLIRHEATGYGSIYFLNEVLKHDGKDIKGMTFALSGFGNVAWGAAKKILALGGKVLSLSGQDGTVLFENGMKPSDVDYMLTSRAIGESKADYANKVGAKFIAGVKPWGLVKADVYMPCATQNEIKLSDAEKFPALGVKYVNEAANMPTTNEAVAFLKKAGVTVCPAKASNAGGVAVSGLEMSQNSARLDWSAEEVDEKLKKIMKNVHAQILEACEKFDLGYDLIAGANIAGFKKVADAMIAQGVI
ncbi:MAG: NADP-specific glutamate dehydrogenase [Clostridia bacterium]|nr:NADP-specific glutamate dehydrogenase [Clostridia bacterium]